MRPIHWHRYPFLFLVIPLIAGILASEWMFDIHSRFILYSIIGSLLLLTGVARTRYGKLFSIFSFLFIFLTGVYCHRPQNLPFVPGNVYTLQGRCERITPPDKAIISSNGIRIFTRYRDSIRFSVGDSLLFDARVYLLSATGNPHEFDYNTYLRHQNIQAQAIPISTPTRIGHSEDLYSFCHSLQQHLLHKLSTIVPDSTTYNLLAALCLGDRQNLTPGTKQLFQDTGTIHLLAISGLHIGAIYLLLLYGLRLFKLRDRRFTLALIPLLWLITGITGLSPSACRAATILSFIIIGEAFRLDYVPLNAIAAAAFFTLLIQPTLLYSVSFQMSYAAYTGIILVYPLITIKRKALPRLTRKIYPLLAVSFSAQILTLPITAYYFHTISLNSILFNLVAVPVATLLLYLGAILLVLPSLIGSYLAYLVTGITQILLYCLRIFSGIAINLTELYPTSFHIILIYIITLSFILYVTSRQRRIAHLFLASTCLLVIFIYGYTFHKQNRQEIVVYNRYRHSVILLNHKGYYSLLKNTDTIPSQLTYTIANDLQPLPEHDGFIGDQIIYTNKQLQTRKQTITIADGTCPTIPDQGILIITGNIFPISDTTQSSFPSQIIIDQSNTPRCIRAWDEFCIQKQIPLFKTNELGSIVIPLK
ncbi:ComEC/Rec2 family competence protein [Butyricimonas hominis]|uniref:ComEC/Rec2 family competence protein n=1 Tax=Butyricimonas hominis TaxID=2763032 RepID=A0ABR7D5Q6_9BACT|nr:ComEC/Rec2 family competence protein [Butyricimonas hominis]MBC5623274.1 ComEC/Rec2 family competence protein [Butyricimonas hominis]